jgi:integrase/recombinase XerD
VEQGEAEAMAKIYKRGEIYWGRVSYRGKEYRKSLETTAARIANERLLSFVSDVKSGNWGDKPRRKFEDAANKFIDEHFPRIKPNSAKRYRVSLMSLHDHLDVIFLDEITSATLSDFEVARRKAGVSNGTIRRDLMCLSSLFSCATDWEWVTVNPVSAYLRKAKKRGLVEAEPRSRFCAHDEEAKILDRVQHKRATVKGDRDTHGWLMFEAALMVAIDTGLRDQEQFGLEWPQVNLKAREVTITWRSAKSMRSRTVPLLGRSLKALTDLPRSKHSQYVFWHGQGQRYLNMYRQLQRIVEKLELPHMEWHDLRRTCGVRLLRDHHMSMDRVSLWLGHSSISVTEKVYAFLSVDELHRAVADSPLTRKNVAQFPAQLER